VIVASALAALIQYVMSALMVATPDRLAFLLLADHVIFVTVLFALAVHYLRTPDSLNRGGVWARAGIALLVGIFIVIDATADSLLAISGRMPLTARHAIYATAVTFKTHDDRLFQLVGQGTTDLVLAGSVAHAQAMEAQGWLERSAALDSYDPYTAILRARLAIALALTTQERNYLDAADSWFALATRQWPSQPMLWLEWAQFVLNLRQEPARAIQFAERAQQLKHSAPGSDRLIGNANRILSRNLEAAQAYRIALKVDPKDSAAAIALSQILTERGDLREARAILTRAFQRATITLKRIQILSALALVIEKQGEPRLALRYVDSALSVASNPVDRSRLREMRTRLREQIQSR
jgi:Flp pilus assembly protein TadD